MLVYPPSPNLFYYSVAGTQLRLLFGGGTAAEVPGCTPVWLSLLSLRHVPGLETAFG